MTTDAGAPAVVKPTFAPGTVIAGRYRLESRLGAGGGGTVWRCFDTHLSTTVAFKIVAEDVDLERWRREVVTARRIADNNVCRVHDLGEAPECRFVTMELVEGTSLRSKCHVDLPADEGRALFRQIVSGTAAIHTAGIVHRDLKPENVVVEPGGRAVIVDFGLAKEPRSTADTVDLRAPAHTVTNTGVVVGTPRYMAPEQAVGDTVDARADVWALGLIGHELLSGAFPGMEEDGGRHVGELAKWPRAAPIVRRCLSLLPKDRFEDARALLAALAEPKRGGARIAIAVVAAVVATLAVIGVRALVRKAAAPATPSVQPASPNPIPVSKSADVKITQVTTTLEKNWPEDAPMSVAISPDATRFAYTTPARELVVRTFADGTPKKWPLPVTERPRRDPNDEPFKYPLSSAWVVGWYSDGTVAVLGQTREPVWQLYRLSESAPPVLVHEETQRFAVAITPDDIPVIPKHDALVDARNERRLVGLGGVTGITALAVSPDGKRIASIGAAEDPDEVVFHVHSLADEKTVEVWRGVAANPLGELLVWLDNDRLAFGATPPLGPSQLFTHDLRTRQTARRGEISDDYIASGSIARGTLLLLRGTAPASVHIGERRARQTFQGSAIAGWLDDNVLVFAQGDPGKQRIVRASLTDGKHEPWPNTTPGAEIPDAVAAKSVFTHRKDGEQIVVERIADDGTHTELARLPQMPVTTFVRCADETAEPCVLEQVSGDQVTWTKLDLATNKLDKLVGSRPRRASFKRSAAISSVGNRLVVVDGTEELAIFPFDGPSSTTKLESAPHAVASARDGALWVSTTHDEGRLFGFGYLKWYRDHHSNNVIGGLASDDQLRWTMRPAPSPDGKHMAVLVRELHVDIARVDGL